jgi:hypothetical protein
MIYPIWRLSENTADNLGLAFTDDGLLLGRTPLIERRDGRFVVREPSEIARLIKYSFPNGVAIDRLLPGLTTVASALNANDQARARIAAVHLRIPDVPSLASRDAMLLEDALIKYERGDWDPELHPRAGTPPNAGWFATTNSGARESGQGDASDAPPSLRIAANENDSQHADIPPVPDHQQTLQPGNPIDEPASLNDRPASPDFWSNVWPAVRTWLEEPVPEYDLEGGQVGQRPRWQALAPYVGIPAATAGIFGLEAFAPTFAAWLGLGAGTTAEVDAAAAIAGPRILGSFPIPEGLNPGTTTFGNYAHGEIAKLLQEMYPDVQFIFRVRPGQIGPDIEVGEEWINVTRFRFGEIKPLTASGRSRLNRQITEWELSDPVQPFTYDAAGNVFRGFH